MKNYLELLQDILDHGAERSDRTGTGTVAVFGRQLRFDLAKGFPLVTTKRVHVKSIIHELLWFLSGETNIRYLQENGVRIWNEWADENGELGPVYGSQWRSWEGKDGRVHDQIAAVVQSIQTNPDSRRHMVSAWNVAEIDEMKLPPCHFVFQFQVANGRLNCMFTMRSSDTFLGLPFNIAQYAMLTHMIAQQCDLEPGELIYSGGGRSYLQQSSGASAPAADQRAVSAAQLVMKRRPESIFDYRYEDFEIVGYEASSHD